MNEHDYDGPRACNLCGKICSNETQSVNCEINHYVKYLNKYIAEGTLELLDYNGEPISPFANPVERVCICYIKWTERKAFDCFVNWYKILEPGYIYFDNFTRPTGFICFCEITESWVLEEEIVEMQESVSHSLSVIRKLIQ